jgi:hypothetical protein
MMSSTAWACLVLLPATLRLVSGVAQCYCITRSIAVPDKWSTALTPCCSRTVATRLTALPAQSC